MEKGRSFFRWTGILISAVVISVFAFVAYGVDTYRPNEDAGRADVIMIDSMKIFGDLERPAVLFLHESHTKALEKKGKDCSACHLSYEAAVGTMGTVDEPVKKTKRISTKFMRLDDVQYDEVMDIYHSNCIECHKETKAANEKAGPITCGECHKKDADVESNRSPMGLDLNLHYRHVKAHDKKCEQCHHAFDTEKEVLFYAKGKEGTCRYCHKEETEENRISMKLASHVACIDCHRKVAQKAAENADESPKTGPMTCSGCHDPLKQSMIKKLEDVPRLERNQPDTVVIKTEIRNEAEETARPEEEKNLKMNPVAYNHKGHETYNDTCRVCHHESMESCAKCHTIYGSEDGDFVKLEGAMHLTGYDKSCVGCHAIKQKEKKCAGCHQPMGNTPMKESECKTCHMQPVEGLEEAIRKNDTKEAAAKMLESREPVQGTYETEDIPEKVVIKHMVDKYEAVEFPHRKIVQSIVKGIDDNKIAQYFHAEKGTVCQGCHHNSPVSKKPPKCTNCHGKPFKEDKLHTPGILGAYHRQCIGCHQVMEIEKPRGCTECHKEKKK